MPNRDRTPASNIGKQHTEPDRRPKDAHDRTAPQGPGGRDAPRGEADAVNKTTRRGER